MRRLHNDSWLGQKAASDTLYTFKMSILLRLNRTVVKDHKMNQNVFDILLSRNKKRRPCPCCGVKMRVGALEKHVECCLAGKERDSRRSATAYEAEKEIEGVAKATYLPRSSCSTIAPSCKMGRLGEGSTTLTESARQGGTPLKHESQEVKGDNNAFEKIMRTARLANFNEEFWMVRNSQGQLKWGWGAAGSGPSPKVVPRAWTSKIISSKATGSYCLLWTNISSAEEGQQPSPSHSTGLSRLSTACVKSMVQKAVRRRQSEPAVRCGAELIIQSWTDFLRRLPIIMVEDAAVHPALPVIVWLMLATSRNYQPQNTFISPCLSILHEVALGTWKDNEAIDDSVDLTDKEPSSPTPTHQPYFSREFTRLPHSMTAAICRCLSYRADYGGMKGDVQMMNRSCSIWYQRFSEGIGNSNSHLTRQQQHIRSAPLISGKQTPPFTYIDPEFLSMWKSDPYLAFMVDEMDGFGAPTELIDAVSLHIEGRGLGGLPILRSLEDTVPAGIDFHCSSILDHCLSAPSLHSKVETLLHQMKNSDDMMNEIRSAMWNFRSGVNFRCEPSSILHDGPLWDAWAAIKPTVEMYAASFISKRLAAAF